jgi:Ser/Thr protein kinase RdoA (MazF antagonist)
MTLSRRKWPENLPKRRGSGKPGSRYPRRMSKSRDEETTESFHRLSPEHVLRAVEYAGLVPSGHCFALNALENRVYDVRLEDGRHVVAKFYRPGRWSREAILDEHRLLDALAEAEIPVVAPLAFPDGETVHEEVGIAYALWPRVGGRAPDEFTEDEIAVLGRLLARIHAVAARVGALHRPTLDPESGPLTALARLDEGGFLPPACRSRYVRAVEALVGVYRERAAGLPLQPIHGDCHAGNLLRGEGGWLFLDFDDLIVGPPVQDVWMLLPGRDPEARRQRRLLVEAYRTFRDFDEASLSLVEPLRGFRFVFYAGWIARRWADPAFPDAFPHFGTDAYWEEETRDLESLVDRIERGTDLHSSESEAVAAASGDEALTNEDFFWDL